MLRLPPGISAATTQSTQGVPFSRSVSSALLTDEWTDRRLLAAGPLRRFLVPGPFTLRRAQQRAHPHRRCSQGILQDGRQDSQRVGISAVVVWTDDGLGVR